MKLKFLGAAGTVTGSKYLLESKGYRVLIDCGLFQGLKELRLRNWDKFPIDPASINAVLLTHAHIDHTGYLPLLVKAGFKGLIYCTPATLDLCKIMLPDSGRLQEEEANYANRRGYSKHRPALPLYTQADAETCLTRFKTIPYGEAFALPDGSKIKFANSGHLLGSAFITLEVEGKRIVFSGDIGRPNDPILPPPTPLEAADYLVVESTYGNRVHSDADPQLQLKNIIDRAMRERGVVVVPAFSVGRSQTLMFLIYDLRKKGLIPDIPVFLNSPMSINASGIFCDYQGEHRLSVEQCEGTCEIATYVQSPEESKRLNLMKGPMVIISANGMATGGRILHHLKAFAPHPENTILFAGYQSKGTRGASMVQGAKELKIHGQQIPVRARVEVLDNISGHADANEIMAWLSNFKTAPRRTFITHGEPEAAAALQSRIREIGWNVEVPTYLQEVELV